MRYLLDKQPQHRPNLLTKAMVLAVFLSLGLGKAVAADPMNIDELISKGIQTHPTVGSAVADEQSAKEGVTAAKLNFLPTPSISSAHDSEQGLVSKFTIRQPLWSGGQLTANVNRAIFENKAASAYVFEQQNTVAKNIIDVWQSYIYAVALQELYMQNLQELREFEAMMQRRVSQGVSARIELDLVKNRILQDYNSHQSAAEQQKIAEARLEQMIGEQVGNASVSVPMALLAKYAEEESKDYGAMAFSDVSQGNPSVIRQQYQVEAAKQEVKSQQASRYPKVYAQYEYAYYHKGGKKVGDLSWGMSYDPGAGFSNFALERASQARVQSLMQTREAARRTVMESIQTQYQQFVSSKDQQSSLVAAIEGAKIVVESYQRQFIAGRKSWLEVLNAVREHSQYQQQLLQVQAQMVASFYKLRVDFGAMPWQQQTAQALSTTTPFNPTTEFYKMLGQYTHKKPSEPVAQNDSATQETYTPVLDEVQTPFVATTDSDSTSEIQNTAQPIQAAQQATNNTPLDTKAATNPKTPTKTDESPSSGWKYFKPVSVANIDSNGNVNASTNTPNQPEKSSANWKYFKPVNAKTTAPASTSETAAVVNFGVQAQPTQTATPTPNTPVSFGNETAAAVSFGNVATTQSASQPVATSPKKSTQFKNLTAPTTGTVEVNNGVQVVSFGTN